MGEDCHYWLVYFALSFSLCRHKTRKVRDLWWLGLPPGVRGEVWKKALRNDLNISPGTVYMQVTSLHVCVTD